MMFKVTAKIVIVMAIKLTMFGIALGLPKLRYVENGAMNLIPDYREENSESTIS